MLKAQQRVEETQFDLEEGNNSNRYKGREETVIIESKSVDSNQPSTSKKSPNRKEESQSSAEDMR